jgi:hypothetical protein
MLLCLQLMFQDSKPQVHKYFILNLYSLDINMPRMKLADLRTTNRSFGNTIRTKFQSLRKRLPTPKLPGNLLSNHKTYNLVFNIGLHKLHIPRHVDLVIQFIFAVFVSVFINLFGVIGDFFFQIFNVAILHRFMMNLIFLRNFSAFFKFPSLNMPSLEEVKTSITEILGRWLGYL